MRARPEKRVPVLYTDIDGTIRWGKDELGRFVNTADDVRVFDGVADLLWTYKKLGWRIVGISNQGGIALGHMTMATCVKAMQETHRQTRSAFDKLLWCSHHPGAENPEMARCWCRKPKAGLVIEGALALAEQHQGEIYPPHVGLFVGDRPEDAACAQNADLDFMAADVWRTGKHLERIR
jgi:D-glycero-D-manno-heptose 1,7-bisphosphate phosphatase